MCAETSKVEAKGERDRQAGRKRRRRERAGTYRQPFMDVLEARELLAVLPATTFNPTTVPVSAVSNDGNASAPSIAVDPNNPQKLAAVWTQTGGPDLPQGVAQEVKFATSNDGGQSWVIQGTPGGFSFPASYNPTTTNPVVLFTNYNNASIGFDRNDNIYILYEGDLSASTTAPSASGVLLLSKYNFSTGSPDSSAGQGFVNKEVYKWVQDPAISPTLTVDTSVPAFSDTDSSGATVSQNDPYSGNVYVSWTSTDVAPAYGPTNYDPNRIRLVASTDGGNTFSGVQVLNNNGNYGTNRPATPQITVSQGAAPRAPGTDGPNDPGSPGVAPGQISAVWDDWGVGATASPPFDEITSNRVADGAAAQTFASPTNVGITDAGPGTPNSPATTDVPIDVDVTDPRFLLQSISDVTVNLAIVHPTDAELQIVLVPPQGSGLPSLTLLDNQINAAGTTNTGVGVAGANLGIAADGEAIGTTFDDNATRNIVDINNTGGRGAAAPFVGFFQPEGGSLDGDYANGNTNTGPAGTPGSVNGQWTLRITDFRNDSNPVQFLRDASITFTAGFTPGVQTNVASTYVRSLQSGAQIASNATPSGIAATPVIASDNTLGAYSPYEGRLYVAYVDRNQLLGNPADNTDIFLAYSDDGGISWTQDLNPVNDDNATTDGFSQGSSTSVPGGGNTGREQFQPNIAVDPITGTVAMSWYDARYDADDARVVTETTTSIDGGQTFSPDTYANDSQTATDTITGKVVVMGPITDNQSAGAGALLEPIAGFGVHQGLAIYGGKLYPIWSSNQNGGSNAKQPLGIRTNVGTYNAGPSVLSVTQGPIGGPDDSLNTQTAADGTPELTSFEVTFDRPINPASFTPSDVRVYYRDTTPTNATGGYVPVSTVTPLDANSLGATQFLVTVPARSGVGTYSVTILDTQVTDQIKSIQTTVVPTGSPVTLSASDLPQSVPANSTVDSVINVPAAAFPAGDVVSSVSVFIGSIQAQDASSLSLTLISPTGTRIPLSNHAPFPYAGGQNYTGTLFTDSAPQSINQGTAPFSSAAGYTPISPLNQLSGEALAGSWTLEVSSSLTPLPATFNSWSLNLRAGTVTTATVDGNSGTVNYQTGAAPGGAYATGTLPLIVPGPHVVSTSVPGAAPSADNVVLDTAVSSLEVTFDRLMNAATFTPADVLRIMGPTGPIVGTAAAPIRVVPLINGSEEPAATAASSFLIEFPAQDVSGTYTVTLASSIQDVRGDALDTNENAGVALLQGVTTGATTADTYTSTQPVQIPASKTVVSTINVPATDDFQAQGVTVQLNIADASDPDLQITLVSPNNVPVVLVPYGTGNVGNKSNFSNTIFDDSASTLIGNGAPQFFGSYKPLQPLSTFNGTLTAGAWKLIISANPAATDNISGTLNSWSLSFQKGSTSTGLGEPVADQYTGSFRIFNSSPTNPLSSTTWTGVGPASMVDADGEQTNNGFAGSVGAIAVDPSDPSGNTVYVAGAQGGIWKTSDFLTTSPQGPTYIPLTNFGPTSGLYISSIALFPRNNDPKQTIVIAGTGEADTSFNDGSVYGTVNTGVGFLRSMDGGATWTLLDSTNNNLPFAQRDHLFALGSNLNTGTGTTGTVTPDYAGGTEIMKVVADPHLTPSGGVILYAAVKSTTNSNDGGLYRSTDTGMTWTKLSSNALGNATDVTLDLASATVDAVSNPTGNVNIIYAAFPSSGVYISPNRGQVLNPMTGGDVDPLIIDEYRASHPQVAVNNGTFGPVNANWNIVLAKPALVPSTNPRADIENTLYEGWLYAAVSQDNADGDVAIYLTKDYGQTWTSLGFYSIVAPANLIPQPAVPTNNPVGSNYGLNIGTDFNHPEYNLAMTVDANNPNVIYIGGTENGTVSGLIRIDSTKIFDSHAVVAYSGTNADAGSPLQINSTGPSLVDDNTKTPTEYIGTSGSIANPPGSYLNLLTDPGNPFNTDATLFVYNIASFANSGSGVTWTPEDQMLQADAESAVPSSNIHSMVSYTDPTTGQTRLIVGDDEGVFTAVFNSNGTINYGIGSAVNSDGTVDSSNGPNSVSPTFSRNGNLAIAQLYTGAAQTSLSAVTNQVSALFYGNGLGLGQVASDGNILSNGNTVYTGSTNGSTLGYFALTSADQAGTGVGVGTSSNGDNLVYRYLWPEFGGNGTDFFQVSVNGGPFISRTTGLVQTANDPQWPGEAPVYQDGLVFGNFTVNPIDGDQVLISSASGRIFSTINQGEQWLSIAEPGSLDGSYASALAYGAPDPKGPAGIGNLNNFLYAGTVDGNIFVTQTGGGSSTGGDAWTKVSGGLDGSPVVKIVPDPNRGNHDAYAVTQKGVYYIANSTATGATWVNITGKLFALQVNAFGNASLATNALNFLTSLQADWRYVIPNDPKGLIPTGTHPILYVSGDSGVYRSLDNGETWTPFPNQAVDGAPVDGGYLPNVQVNDLTIADGAIDPTNGQPMTQPGDPDDLLATTGGLGQYMIRLAPIVFPTSLALDTKLPAPSGSVAGKDAQGLPIVRVSQPVIDGLSEQSAFGNTVRITILDETDPNNVHVIGGYNPALGTTDNPTDVPANYTNAFGNFQVQVSPTGFLTNGVKTIGIEATDASGTVGNVATIQIDLQATLTSITAPTAPVITLDAASDSSGGRGVTNDTTPQIDGTTSPNSQVALSILSGPGYATSTPVGTTTADGSGNFTFQLPSLQDGTFVLQAVATNTANNLSTTGPTYSFQVKTVGPTITPTLSLLPASDTGVKGDGITSDRFPFFIGTTDANALVSVYRANANGQPSGSVLATATASATGSYTIQLPFALSNGPITLVATVHDLAGNPEPPATPLTSTPLTITETSVAADFTATGVTTPAVFRRAANGAGVWFVYGVPPASGTSFGGATVDIPFTGDFDGDGKADLALFRPTTDTWYIQRSSLGFETFTLGGPGSVPAVADFDGDGKTDAAAYNPTTGVWQLAETTNGFVTVSMTTGGVFTPQAGDVPVPGDYSGGMVPDQLAVYRPSTGQFFIQTGNTVAVQTVPGWTPGDVPVPGDYDDSATRHETEPAVYNPGTGTYFILGPSGVHTATFSPGDVPAPGDYLGTGQTQPAVYHHDPTTGLNMFIVNSPTSQTVTFGGNGDIPVTAPLAYRTVPATAPTVGLDPSSVLGPVGGDVTSDRRPFLSGQTDPNTEVDLINPTGTVLGTGMSDGTGHYKIQLSPNADLADGTYLIRARAHGLISPQGPVSAPVAITLVTVAGDFTGNGTTDPAIFRRLSTYDAQWFVQNVAMLNGRHFGAGGLDVPIAADLYGDGKDDLVLYRPSTAQWFVEQASTGYTGVLFATFGTPGSNDIPVPADYTGSGHAQLALYRPSTGQLFIGGQAPQTVFPGQAGDVPVPANYDNTGKDEFAVFRPGASAQWIINGPQGAYSVFFGGTGDVPVPDNYYPTATSRAVSLATFNPASGRFNVRTPGGGTATYQFAPGDVPIPGDYYGSGAADPAVYRPSTGQILVVPPGQTTPVVLTTFGANSKDVPVLAPYANRALGNTVAKASVTTSAMSVDLGSTARSLSLGSTSAADTTAARPSTTTVATVNFASRVRPVQAAPVAPVAPSPFASLTRLVKRKGHRHPA